MNVIRFASLVMLLLLSSKVVAEDRVPESVPEWLFCVSETESYKPWRKIFVSLPNEQVWGYYETEAAALFGRGLTTHNIKYSFADTSSSSGIKTHNLNGYIDAEHIRFSVSPIFNYLEIAKVSVSDGLILDTPSVEYYKCNVTLKPKMITDYEIKYLKSKYLDKYKQVK